MALHAGYHLLTYMDYILSFGPENYQKHIALLRQVVETVQNACCAFPEMRPALRQLVTANGQLLPPRNYYLGDCSAGPRCLKLATLWLEGGSRNWLGLPRPPPIPASEVRKAKAANNNGP